MKKRIITMAMMSVTMAATVLFAADPGGTVGLAKATFTGSSFDTASDVMVNAAGYVLVPEEMYASSLPEKITVAWSGYMRMEAGVTYDFKGCYDDYVSVKINGAWILSKGSECQERTGSYVPTATDWYPIEFRVANNGGGGGCQNASQYGILWKKNSEADWRQVSPYDEQGVALFKTGRNDLAPVFKTTPIVLSSKMRENAPTIMDVTYIVHSTADTVNVRALAFEDGERSFWKVVRPETFVNDPEGNPTVQNIGDNIPANVMHKLAWKVDSDWETDLAKVKFEILTSEQGQLPLDLITIPATAKTPEVTVSYNSQTSANVFNALLWYYADGAPDIYITNGYLYKSNGDLLSNRTAPANMIFAVDYCFGKMGYEGLNGTILDFARAATRKALNFNDSTQNGYRKSELSNNLYIGEKAYCVIDVSGGTSASSYPVTYLDSCPIAGWGDEYKTTKILLRRIEPGFVKMGDIKPVTLTKPFYIGVFEITQKQYQLVAGSNPSTYKGDMRPVEYVSWNDIRGDSSTYNWPDVTTVDPGSFVGRLQAKTGLNFDLPTESQWEYACRAGTTSYYNNGGSSDNDLKQLGRFVLNRTDSRGGYPQHTTVGSYSPNAWGLYDMHGNVLERCLDKATLGFSNSDPVTDYQGEGTGHSERKLRGGNWGYGGSNYARSSCREVYGPSLPNGIYYVTTSCRSDLAGFRLSRTLANE